MVAVTIRTIFAQLTPAEVADQVDKVATTLQPRFPAVAALLVDAKEDLTAFRHVPVAHWRKLWSTNPLERLNKELKRRTNVVGIFPTTPRSPAWPPPCSSKPMTNGRSPTAATCRRAPWPCSSRSAMMAAGQRR